MTRGGCVYIMTNKTNNVLYTGVTSDLIVRVQEHRGKIYQASFTSRYNVFKLVYYMFYSSIEEAIAEEKRIKGGNRQQKLDIINKLNPGWEDLWDKEVSKW